MVDKTKKILLTGGHAATTAIAVIEELLRRKEKGENLQIYWIGAKYAQEGKKEMTLEAKIFPKMGISFSPIITGRLQRRFTLWTIPSLFKIPLGIIQALVTVFRIKPEVVLSFGGFAAFPVVFAAWVFGVPVLVHEQTATAGLANRFSAFFAHQILLSRAESEAHYPSGKTMVVGNPVMSQIREVEEKKSLGKPPVVLVMGGSRGAKVINDVVFAGLEKLTAKYQIIHLTGEVHFHKFMKEKRSNYEPLAWVDPLEIDNLYRAADIVVARAGANTVSEIIMTRRPAIFIPIPWSYLDEQSKNAHFLASKGGAEVIRQKELTVEKLLATLERVTAHWAEMVASFSQIKTPDAQASEKVVDELERYWS